MTLGLEGIRQTDIEEDKTSRSLKDRQPSRVLPQSSEELHHGGETERQEIGMQDLMIIETGLRSFSAPYAFRFARGDRLQIISVYGNRRRSQLAERTR